MRPNTQPDSLEIIYLYQPVGLVAGERSLRGLELRMRSGTTDELLALHAYAGALTLFVLTPQQYLAHREAVHQFHDAHRNSASVGFFLVEDHLEPATVRQRKRLQAELENPYIAGDLRAPYTFNQAHSELAKAAQHLYLSANRDLFRSMAAIREIESKAINEVGLAMTSQSSTEELMRLILDKCLELSNADAGFLLLRDNLMGERSPDGGGSVKLLRSHNSRFVQKARICRSQNIRLRSDLLDPASSTFTSLVVNRACGISWSEGMDSPHMHGSHNGTSPAGAQPPEIEFDSRNYRVASYCAFPLKTPSEEVVGYILLLNRRVSRDVFLDNLDDVDSYVTSFPSYDLNILEALASQAGVSIDHTRLIKDLKTVFESFVQASVTAIESRDPGTKGHSERVAKLTVGLAEAVNRTYSGPYANIQLSPGQIYELRYAALLHDFGKIGVREDVLRKEKKLFPGELSLIKGRFLSMEKQLHLKCLEVYLEGLMAKGQIPTRADIDRIGAEVSRISEELDGCWEAILEANEPNVVNAGNFQRVAEIAAARVIVGDASRELLLPEELERLSIRRGSLSPEERREIESHVEHSYKFLIQIPWTTELANLPEIVYGHHERLDGSGYPRRLTGDEIPMQAKMMAITDVYDALVAMDRPYKKSIPHERALSILEAEVREGKLDGELFKVFVEAKIGELILPGAETKAAS